MKKAYIILLALAGQAVFASAQDSKTPYLTKSLASDGIKKAFVNTSGGSITVSGASGQQPRIEMYITGNNGSTPSNDEIKRRLDEDYIVDINVSGGELHASAKRKHENGNWDWRRQLNIAFKVYVPQNTATNLKTSGGSIHLDNLTGDEKFETSGGSLHVDNLTGHINGRTSGGSVWVQNSKNDIDMETSGGSVHASDCSGTIRLETSGGSLNFENLNGRINAETSGGSIHGHNIKGDLRTGTSGGSIDLSGLSGSLDTYTSGGSIHVQMASVTGKVKIDASGGHVDLQLPSKQGFNLNLRAERVTADINGNFDGTKEKDRIEGKLNGGGPTIDVNGSNRVNLTLN